MSKIITVFIELMSATLEWLHTNLDGIIVSIVAAVILSLIHYIKNKPKEINELLKCKNFNDINWIDDLDKSLEIKNTMKRHFPEYTDYLLIQYGSSVESNNKMTDIVMSNSSKISDCSLTSPVLMNSFRRSLFSTSAIRFCSTESS